VSVAIRFQFVTSLAGATAGAASASAVSAATAATAAGQVRPDVMAPPSPAPTVALSGSRDCGSGRGRINTHRREESLSPPAVETIVRIEVLTDDQTRSDTT
jgi:hypothetical protein